MPKRTYIKPISDRRKVLMAEYRKIKKWWETRNTICCVPDCGKKRDDTHHVFGRVGILLVAWECWKPLCRAHHDKLKQPGGVAWGRSLGLLPPLGQHNTLPEYLKEKYGRK